MKEFNETKKYIKVIVIAPEFFPAFANLYFRFFVDVTSLTEKQRAVILGLNITCDDNPATREFLQSTGVYPIDHEDGEWMREDYQQLTIGVSKTYLRREDGECYGNFLNERVKELLEAEDTAPELEYFENAINAHSGCPSITIEKLSL